MPEALFAFKFISFREFLEQLLVITSIINLNSKLIIISSVHLLNEGNFPSTQYSYHPC